MYLQILLIYKRNWVVFCGLPYCNDYQKIVQPHLNLGMIIKIRPIDLAGLERTFGTLVPGDP